MVVTRLVRATNLILEGKDHVLGAGYGDRSHGGAPHERSQFLMTLCLELVDSAEHLDPEHRPRNLGTVAHRPGTRLPTLPVLSRALLYVVVPP